ncbi:MAG: hypothetical protein L6437_14190 [Kiritimatiellae bacterium]|nr:hypothetical protein [Kiritimatiellia bacterium]
MIKTGATFSMQEQRLVFWHRTGLLILSAMAAGVLAIYYPQVTDDTDIWWHLRYGEAVLYGPSWCPDHSLYSWTPADGAWVYVTWLGSLILYGIYRAGGFFGLALMQWGIFTGVAALYAWFLRLAHLPWTALNVVMLFLAGIAINPIAVYIKPELFSLLMFAVTIAIFYSVKLTGKSICWIYVPLFLFWVNIHCGFVYGIAFLGMAWCGESLVYVLDLPTRLSKSTWRQFTAALGLSVVMTLVNPYGWRYAAGILQNALAGAEHVQVISAYSSFRTYLIPPPFMFRNMNAGWCFLFMAICMGGLLSYAYMARRRIDFTVVLTNAVFFIAGFFMMRVSIFFVVLWLFSVAYVMAAFQIKFPQIIMKVSGITAGLIAALLIWETAAFNTYRAYFGRGLNAYVPVDTVEFIRRNAAPGPLFNDYITGGYLIWALYPDYKVFIDSRYGPYVKTGVWETYARLMKSGSPAMLASIQKKYPFQSAIISTAHCPLLADLFLAAPNWRLVYFDSVAALFVKTPLTPTRHWDGDMSPHRFEHISNPDILARTFALYCSYRPSDAPLIYDIYERNVSRLYAYRNAQLAWMKKSLLQFRRSEQP